MAKADAAQVRALVTAYVPAGESHRALALHADADWCGPTEFEADGRSVRVVACRGPLSVREALVADRDDGPLLVVLTPCAGPELGLDVRTRLVKGDVLPLDPFSSVLALFAARVLDPQLVAERWLIDELVALAPSTGWHDRLPLGGVLDAPTAWRTWHEARLQLPTEPVDLGRLLQACARPEVGVTLSSLALQHRERLGRRWQETTGFPAAPLFVDLAAAGHGAALIGLGFVAGVLSAAADRSDLAHLQTLAWARLEDRFGRARLDRAAAQLWCQTSGELAAGDVYGDAVALAEDELARADASALAVLSAALPSGFELRLGALAEALQAGDLEAAAVALRSVREHRLAARRRHRVEAAEAALRVLRRRQQPLVASASGFAAAASRYAADGAFLDEALRLLRDGDGHPGLADAYARLVTGAEGERERTAMEFVGHLVEWSRSEPVPDERIVPLEHVLDTVVAPVANDAPVLLVVCDGMGLPVAHQLLSDLRLEHWAPAAPEARATWPVGVALLPTVTEASRASLLTGSRRVGGQADERAGFATHPGLRAVSAPARPPVLLHKAALIGPSGAALPDDVRAQVADPDQRVIGVVVNAVDDHLARGDQVRVGWDLASLRPLGWLLDAAAEAGRVVVLTADHGHVLHDRDSSVRQVSAGGERWRPATSGPAADGEVEVDGPRVLLGEGQVVLPASERLRYGGYKHGYHGGATPEEVLVPVVVLARRLPEGWHHLPPADPAWWGDAPPVAEPAPHAAAVLRPVPKRPPSGQSSLFELAPDSDPTVEATAVSWVDELLASPTFVAHRARARLPRPIADSRLRSYLSMLDANGGTMPLQALSSRTGEPADTLRMALTLVQRLVNLDGAEILAVRANGTIELNRALAVAQFELANR